MRHYPYIIVGGGMTADAAAKAISRVDRQAVIAIFSEEAHLPYKRPPLSKALWKKSDPDSIWLRTEQKATLHNANSIRQLDLENKRVIDQFGEKFSFEKLLLATGGNVRHLPFGEGHILYYRYLDDYEKLRSLTEKKNHFLVLGGGFIGSEIAAALRLNGKEVTMVFPEKGIGANVYPAGVSQFLVEYYREKGVQVFPEQLAKTLEVSDGQVKLITDKQELVADQIIAGIGIRPNTALAESAGLEVENGIRVDEYLRTSHPDVYAAGDVASMYNSILQKNMRYEHEDNAVKMGAAAGKNMAGSPERYDTYLPFFYSDLFELGYEAVGSLDSRLSIIEDWHEKNREGVLYYYNEGRVVGILLWNVWDQIWAARQVIQETQRNPVKPSELVGKIPMK